MPFSGTIEGEVVPLQSDHGTNVAALGECVVHRTLSPTPKPTPPSPGQGREHAYCEY